MPTLRFFPPSGSPQLFAVHKPITTLGRALGNDIHVPDASVLSHHAQVVFNGRDFEVEVLDKDAVLAINGKRKRRARLVNGDRLTLGEAQLAFSMFSDTVPADDRESVQPGEEIGALYVANDEIKSLFERAQLDLLTVFAGQASLLLTNAMLVTALRADKKKLEEELGGKRFGEIIGSCPSMQEVFRKLQKVATTDISVLITGETGTGKELIARELHRRSPRAGGPFVTINCGAIPENLIESELFGHVRGAFTGAVANRAGKFQLADGGTLFLDEIGELPLNLQVKLLRALQERVVFRVGDSKPEKVDIRGVAATNRNLDEEIRVNNFREDLYYRLNVVNLWLPPLRDRGDDVMIIAKVLLSKYADELGSQVKGFSPAALAAIKKHAWP